jgi:hypothetical protein
LFHEPVDAHAAVYFEKFEAPVPKQQPSLVGHEVERISQDGVQYPSPMFVFLERMYEQFPDGKIPIVGSSKVQTFL